MPWSQEQSLTSQVSALRTQLHLSDTSLALARARADAWQAAFAAQDEVMSIAFALDADEDEAAFDAALERLATARCHAEDLS